MYCGKCGNKLNSNDKFCNKCGNPIGGSNVVSPIQPQVKQNKKSSIPIVLAIVIPIIVLVGVVALIGGIACIVLVFLSNQNNVEYVDLSGDEIPTIYYVVGERNICNYETSYKNDEIQITYEYCDGELSNSDYMEYVNYLENYEDFVNISDYSSINLVKESDEEGMYIGVEIDRYSDSFVYYKYELDGGGI